jgi:hypothetical protein
VQDLERKLRNAKLEVSNLQSQVQKQRLAALDDAEWSDLTWRRSSDADVRDPIRRVDFRLVREIIIHRSSGLFTLPPAWREPISDPIGQERAACTRRPALPPQLFVEHLLNLFRNEVFFISPSMDPDLFLERSAALYSSSEPRDENGVPVGTSRSWLMVFFAVLAFTSYCIQDEVILQHYATVEERLLHIGEDLAECAMCFFGPITKRSTLDDIRGALLLAEYYKTCNEMGAANLWLGASVKMAQLLGINACVVL